MSSGSKPASYSTTTQSSAPWSGQQEYLTTGFQRARDDILNKPTEFYPNSTVVPFSPTSEQALGLQEQRALAGSPVVQAAQQQVQGTAQGDYLNANPYLTQAITNATQPVIERFQEDIVPSIQSAYSSAGRYGSGLQARGEERAAQAALDQASKIATDMSYRNYGDERGRQLQSAALAPQLGQIETTTAPIYRNTTSDLLGGAATTAGIAGTLFGKQGIFG